MVIRTRAYSQIIQEKKYDSDEDSLESVSATDSEYEPIKETLECDVYSRSKTETHQDYLYTSDWEKKPKFSNWSSQGVSGVRYLKYKLRF
jgi:hypothetical protein